MDENIQQKNYFHHTQSPSYAVLYKILESGMKSIGRAAYMAYYCYYYFETEKKKKYGIQRFFPFFRFTFFLSSTTSKLMRSESTFNDIHGERTAQLC